MNFTAQQLLQPIEVLLELPLPEALNGSRGSNRSFEPIICARNDLEAINVWLKEYENKPNTTYQSYRIEAERILLWALVQKSKALSSLNADDLLEYSNFLMDPNPRERWCSGKQLKVKRWTKDWRPFVGPLSQTSKEKALSVLQSLFKYLVDMRYLTYNPFAAIRRRVKQSIITPERNWSIKERILGIEEWHAILEALEEMPEQDLIQKNEKIRLRFLLALFYFAGLRIEEIVSHTMGSFKKDHDFKLQKYRWWLFIKGKGDKLRKIPVNQSLLEELIQYRNNLGLSELPKNDEEEPLVRSFRRGTSITSRRINQLIKDLTHRAAEKFEINGKGRAERLKKVSAHWFRHLSFSMQDLVEIRKQYIKENAGHSSERTTEIYVHAIDNLRHDEMEKLTWKINLEEKSVI